MKLAIRLFALGVVLIGAAAANSLPKNTPFISGQVPAAKAPVPVCEPDGVNTCGFMER
ncbi:MAG TPA: hypothetical protein VM554_11075 [Acidisarcina sp.]|nr:hypothetical protein [Acidisarcina sp.]